MYEQLFEAVYLLLEPLSYFVQPNKRVFWFYLLSSGLLACVILHIQGVQLTSLFKQGVSISLWFNASSRVDWIWMLLNHVVRALVVVPLLGGQIGLAVGISKALFQTFGEGDFFRLDPMLVSIIFSITVFLLDDFSRFYLHYLYHKLPWLWRFHAIHHSATSLTPITLYRIHVLEMLLNSCRSLLVIGGVSGIFIYCFQGQIAIVTILGVSVFTMLFNLMGANLRHSHIWLGFGRLEKWLISPAQHQIHHSVQAKHIDKNFGAALAVWDRMFGSWLASKKQQVDQFGLHGKKVEQKINKQWLGL